MTQTRVDWVDYAKGICIIMVVMMHATLSWEAIQWQQGWANHIVEFARPFRMPDFFMISGLFLSRTINAPLRDYLDRKVVHFAYFYLLWLVIQMGIVEINVLMDDPAAFGAMLFSALVWGDYQTLWFVHMLAVFFIVTRLLRKVPPLIVFLAAAALQTAYHADLFSANLTIERFCDRYVYFFFGYWMAPQIFKFADILKAHPAWAGAGLLVWGVLNHLMVQAGGTDTPFVSLFMGFFGASAVATMGALLSKVDIGRPIAYVGANSIVVYLTFFFPVKVMHKFLLATNAIPDIGWASIAITAVAVVTPLMFHYAIKNTPLNFLYVRPQRFRIIPARKPQAAGEPISGEPKSAR